MPTATPSYYPCLRRPPRGWRRLAFECGAIFSVLLYTGDTSGRRCVTALQSYTAKKRIHLLFSSAKKRYTALMYVRRPCTVSHGLSARKEKKRIAKKSVYGTHIRRSCRAQGLSLRKEKNRRRSREGERLEPASMRLHTNGGRIHNDADKRISEAL